MRWLKQNLVVLIFLVVFAALLGAIVWVEWKATTRKTEVEADLNNKLQDLTNLQKKDPFPSKENAQLLKRDRDELQKLYQSLQEAVTQNRMNVPTVQNEIEFVERLRKTQVALRELARRNNVQVKEDFAFGFGRYNDNFPCRNQSVRPDDCRRVLASLSKQLFVIERLTTMAISNKVEAITVIRRTEVEPGGTSGSADTFPGSISDDAKARYQKVPFDLQFACSERSLRDFLNSLSQSDWYFLIETLKFSQEMGDSSTRTSASLGGGVDAAVAPTTATPQRKRLTVTMRIDLVEFPVPKPADQTKTRSR